MDWVVDGKTIAGVVLAKARSVRHLIAPAVRRTNMNAVSVMRRDL
jgi:hypothetical protein